MAKLLIPTATGVEAVVKRELFRMGYQDTRAINGRVQLEGDFETIARTNMFLRSGERVLLVLKEFHAETFDEVYDNLFSLNWQEIMPKNARILTYAKSVNSKLFALKALCSIVKKAVVDKMLTVYDALDETGPRYKIEIALFDDFATLSLDTSGDGLHKRGYRTLAYTAPLKETLAAALIDLSYFHPEKEFADVFCGSGTLPIEAGMIAKNIASGKFRDFDYRHFGFISQDFYQKALQEANDKEKRDRKISVWGSDIDENAISIAKYHAKRAGLDKDVNFFVMDMRKFKAKTPFGVLISNPPYGQRIGDESELKTLHSDLGKMCKDLPNWNCYFLSAFENFEKCFGKKADKKRKLFNANIACCYYSFPSPKPKK